MLPLVLRLVWEAVSHFQTGGTATVLTKWFHFESGSESRSSSCDGRGTKLSLVKNSFEFRPVCNWAKENSWKWFCQTLMAPPDTENDLWSRYIAIVSKLQTDRIFLLSEKIAFRVWLIRDHFVIFVIENWKRRKGGQKRKEDKKISGDKKVRRRKEKKSLNIAREEEKELYLLPIQEIHGRLWMNPALMSDLSLLVLRWNAV